MTPDTRPNIFPVLRYLDARAAIDFLGRAFGFALHVSYPAEGAVVQHAELKRGAAVIGLSSRTPPIADNPWTLTNEGVYVVVADVDALHARAVATGATIAMPLRDMDYGSRDFTVRDPEGHLWGFGTYQMASADGTPAVFPSICYRDAGAAIEFLERALGFKTILRVPGVVMLGSGPKPGGLFGTRSHGIQVYLEDPDAHYAGAVAAGASILQAPEDTPYGARGYYADDAEGFLWGFSTYRPGGM
jgi:uncharacterized glyoxalase superfamily protein PhnB